MLSCFQTSRGSGTKTAKSCLIGFFGRLRYLLSRWIRSLTHFCHVFHRDPQVSTQNKQEPRPAYRPPRFTYNSPEFIDQMVHYIPVAAQIQDDFSISLFLAVYHKYATTWEVLDLIMKTAIFSFLFDWFHTFPQHFCESPDMDIVRKLMDYVRFHMPSPEIDFQARELLSAMEEEEARKLNRQKDCATTPEPSVQDASETQVILAWRPASVAEPQGDLHPPEDTELLESSVLDPFVPESEPVQILTLDQALSTSADTESPLDVAAGVAADVTADISADVCLDVIADVTAAGNVTADVPSGVNADVAADVPADVSALRHLFLPAVVQLGAPVLFPLPEVDI